MNVLLDVQSLRKVFGGLIAVNDVTFEVPERTIMSVIGPNGAGKTTFFNVITGIYQPNAGSITFLGKNLIGLRPDEVAERGISRTFQNIRLFGAMTALENVLVARHTRSKAGYLDAIFRTSQFHADEQKNIDQAYEWLDFVGLSAKASELAANLPYGEQRRLEIARSLATNPKLIFLDEPTAGMNPQETEEAKHLILRLRDDQGITVVLIEHDMRVVMTISDTVTVLDYGTKIAEGLPGEVRRNPKVIEAYLGSGAAAGEFGLKANTDHSTGMTGGASMIPDSNTNDVMLELRDVHTYYGQIHALKGISFQVKRGEIVCLIGGNGAGKTTTLRTISNLKTPKQGQVFLKGNKISDIPAHEIIKLGMAHVPEGRRIFPRLTVRENLEIGAFTLKDRHLIDQRMNQGFAYFPRLKEREKQLGGTLSGGEQQMLAVARALMQDPELILLDEPSMGLSPLFVERIFEVIKDLNAKGTTILLVEQNALMALGVSNRGYVLQTGQIVLEGTGESLSKNEEVRKKYLGED